jgi:hypothetical protein
MNSILDTSLQNALGYSQNYTGQAVNTQTQYLQQAMNALTTAGNQLTNSFNQSQGLQQPYRIAGYNALDSYEDTLGMKRPTIGNAAVAQALNDQAVAQGQYQQLQQGQGQLNQLYDYNQKGNTSDLSLLGNAPTKDAMLANGDVTKSAIDSYIKGNMFNDSGVMNYQGVMPNAAPGGLVGAYGQYSTASGMAGLTDGRGGGYIMNNADLRSAVQNELATPYQQQAMSLFGQQQQNYNTLNQYLNGVYTPNQQNIANAANAGLFNAPTMQKVGY